MLVVVVVVEVAVAASPVGLVPAPSLEGMGSTAVGAIMRDVLGDRRTALVRFGSARRETAAGLGFCVCAPSATSLTSAGVGVSGTALVRFFRGVDGALSVSSTAGASVAAFRFLDAAGGAGGGAGMATLVTIEASRADLRDAISRDYVRNPSL
jgi:hypothetical protein